MIKPASSPERSADTAPGHPGWWTVLAILVVAWIGIPWMLPVAVAAPWILFRRRHPDAALRPFAAVRWAVAAWAGAVAMIALAGPRAIRSVPFGDDAVAASRAWVGGGAPVPSWMELIVWTALFAATAFVFRGLAAPFVVAGAIAIAAVHAATVFSSSTNVLASFVAAIPIWTALLVVGMATALEPAARFGLAGVRPGSPSAGRLRLAAGLILAAFVFRLLSSPYSAVLSRTTVH
jgi:hypothetical protein